MALKFEKSTIDEKIGAGAGFLVSYFVFTTLLFFILYFLHKLPANWTYFHIAGITLAITIIGLLLNRYLR